MRTRSTILAVLLAMVFVGASCAKGSTYIGEGGAGGEGGSGPTTTTSGPGPTSGASSSITSGPTSSAQSATSSSSSGGGCAEMPCKLTLPQCGCMAGEQCSADNTGRICSAQGSVPAGQVCGAGMDCAPGALCVQTSPTVSTCMKFCSSDSDCTAPGGLCVVTLNNGMGGSVPDVTLCTENCDPTNGSGCAAGTSCQVQVEKMGQMRYLTACSGAGAGTQGSVCPTNNDCAVGYGCIGQNAQMQNVCLKWCKKAAPSCPAGSSCSSFNPAAIIGGTEYGACL